MTRPLRQESLAPLRMTRYVPGALQFKGYGESNKTVVAAMRRVARRARSVGRDVVWISAVAS